MLREVAALDECVLNPKSNDGSREVHHVDFGRDVTYVDVAQERRFSQIGRHDEGEG